MYVKHQTTFIIPANINAKIVLFAITGEIAAIAKTFITFRNGEVALRYWSDPEELLLPNYPQFEKVELWNHIARTYVPDIFIAAAFVNFGITETRGVYHLLSFKSIYVKPSTIT